MKKLWLKVLSCFMAVNFMFMCFAMPVSAGKINYGLNGEGDGLDVVLKELTIDEWRSLYDICGVKIDVDPYNTPNSYFVEKFNKEIRSNYGNTLINIFRDTTYEPGYGKILLGTAKKLEIRVPDKISIYDVEEIEQKIIFKMLEKLKNGITDKKGDATWKKIEKDTFGNMEKLFQEGKISAKEFESIKKYGIAGIVTGAGAVGLWGSLSGFAIYSLVNSVFWAVANTLGVASFIGGVAVAGPMLATFTTVLISPWFWGLTPFVAIAALGDTNWKKTVASVFFIAMMRQKLNAEKM
ncbi:MAG: hypothetical protein KBS60_03805 [Phascolarctobacterium sp.]|nr:hypothetical protein [Candidatus Phascolarctobacterium caballi]